MRISHVTGKEEYQVFLDVVVDSPPLLYCPHNGCEIVVGEGHVRGFLGNVSTGNAHGYPDISLFEGRGVIHAIPSHGHHLTFLLPGLHNPQFMLRRNSGINPDFLNKSLELLVTHSVQFHPADGRGLPPLR